MSENVRPWLEEGAPEGVRALLESAQLDEPTTAQLASLKAKLLPLFPPAGGGEGSGGEGAPQDGGASGSGAEGSGASASGSGASGSGASGASASGSAGGATSSGAASSGAASSASASAASTATASATGAATTALATGVTKTVLAVALSSAVVGAGSFFAGVQYQKQQAPAAAAPAPFAAPAPVVTSPPEPELPVVTPAPVTPPAPVAAPKRVVKAAEPPKPPPPPPTGAPSNEEVALLQQAMDALKAGRPADALNLLDTYPTRFPSGVLQQEAEVLSIEALVKQGEVARAQQRSKAFRERWPTSTHLIRLESLLRAK